VGASTLSAVSAAVAGAVDVEARLGWVEPTNAYVVGVQPPGSRKSAVFADVFRPIRECERAASRDAAPEIAFERSRRKLAEQVVKAAERRYGEAIQQRQSNVRCDPPPTRGSIEAETRLLLREVASAS